MSLDSSSPVGSSNPSNTKENLRRHLDGNGEGHLKILPESTEDLWQLYNYVHPSDEVEALTYRRVVNEKSAKKESTRMKVMLKIQVQSISIDLSTAADAQNDPTTVGKVPTGTLSLTGKICKENAYASVGSFHTLHIWGGLPFKLFKCPWESLTLYRLQKFVDSTAASQMETFAVIMELGIAHLCLITNYTTLLLEKVTLTIPAKKSTSQYEAKITKFYKLIMDAMVRHLRIEEMKCCILASPGFYKEAFFHFLTHTIASTNSDMSEFSAAIKKHKSKFILVHSSNGFLDALTQVLKDPLLRSKIQETKSLKETRSLNLFLETLRTKPDEAFYGVEAVQAALKMKAVKALLLSSTLLRSLDLETRLTYHKIANDFERKKSGELIIFESKSEATERLDHLTGIAAILLYPVSEAMLDY